MLKKFVVCFLTAVICASLLSACSATGPYKRISLSGEMLGEANSVFNETVADSTVVENLSNDSFPDKLPVYQISKREITRDDFKQLAAELGISTQMVAVDVEYWRFQQGSKADEQMLMRYETNAVSYVRAVECRAPLPYDDDELISMAQEVVNKLSLVNGEKYECVGVSSTQTLITDDDEFVVKKRVSFRRLIDGFRVIGNDICDVYFSCGGLCGIEIKLYDYEAVDEMELITLENAFKKVKNPDAFSLTASSDKNFSGKASKLTVNRTKLLLVNQYSSGCEILQPVYNFIGVAENESGSVEFSSRIIAIPEKYTHD